MEYQYLWFALVGLVVGVIFGRLFASRNFGIPGDILFGVAGAAIFGYGFEYLHLIPESGLKGALVMAAIGAIGAVAARRALRSV